MMCLGKSAKGVAAGASCVHHSGHSRTYTPNIGLYSVVVHTVVHLSVRVDQPGGDYFALYLENLLRLFDGYAGSDSGDLALFYCHVIDRMKSLGRINNRPTLDQQVVRSKRNLSRLFNSMFGCSKHPAEDFDIFLGQTDLNSTFIRRRRAHLGYNHLGGDHPTLSRSNLADQAN